MEISVSSNISAISGSVSANSSGSKNTSEIQGASTADSTWRTNGDSVELSPEARDNSRTGKPLSESEKSPPSAAGETYLTQEQQQQLRELKARDREVRTHEQAHLSAAGQYAAGSASFTYQLGPDGSRYAVGGEVPIDISKEATPEATLQKMAAIRSAALAPAEPSAADRQIAAQAALTASQAQQDLIMMQQEHNTKSDSESADEDSSTVTDTTDSSSNREYPGGITVSAMINAYTSMRTHG
jgi:hypothetical protein